MPEPGGHTWYEPDGVGDAEANEACVGVADREENARHWDARGAGVGGVTVCGAGAEGDGEAGAANA